MKTCHIAFLISLLLGLTANELTAGIYLLKQEKPAQENTQKEATQEKQKSEKSKKNSESDSDKPKGKEPEKQSDGTKQAEQNDNSSQSESETQEKPQLDNTPTPIDWSVKGVKELNFDHMKFNIQPDEKFQIKQLTADLIKLRGHKIRIRGYIRPAYKSEGITNFILVRDNQECCFGPGAALYDCMIVNLDDGETTDFSTRPITVEGTFQLKPYRMDKRIMAILNLKDAKVE